MNKSGNLVPTSRIRLNTVIGFFGLLWLLSIIFFAGGIIIASNFFQTTVDKGPLQADIWGIILLINIFVGLGSFLVFALFLTVSVTRNKSKTKANLLTRVRDFFFFFITLALLPLVLLFSTWRPPKKTLLKKIFSSLLILVFLLPVWIIGYVSVAALTADQLGLVAYNMDIVGTGSMYPTFPKGEGKDPKELASQIVGTQGMFRYPNGLKLFGKRYLGHIIDRGDIITVEDEKTRKATEETYGEPSGWLKRVIAISGDTIEIRDGILYLNGEAQKEPYIAKARSTFGQSFLQECQQITVPENSVFVMGDNRKSSRDSRDLGFFSLNDIKSVLPFEKQIETLSQNWHDATNDLEESSRITLNKAQYLEILNAKRQAEGLKPLKYQEKLEASAQKRGEVILKYNDFSFEATASGYTMQKALSQAGYSNTFWGEAPTLGYYEAEELIENQLEFPESKEFISDKRFQDIGIAEIQGEINGCPTHVIVQHFGGYIPPNYSASDIKSWEDALQALRSIQPSWNNLKNSGDFYNQHKEKVDRLNQVIDLRINRMTDIVGTMRANKWLSAEQIKFADIEDMALYREQEELATFLNSR